MNSRINWHLTPEGRKAHMRIQNSIQLIVPEKIEFASRQVQ